MKNIISARASRPFSWGAVIAGVVVGAVASMIVLAIGAFITFLFGLSFSLTGFMGLFWFALSALVGAFVAGNVAVNAQAPATTTGNVVYQAITKTHATLTGGVTAALLVLFTTFFAASGISSIIGATASAVGTVGSAVGSAIGTTAQTAAVAGANADFNFDQLPSLEEHLGNISEDEIAEVLSNNTAELSEEQIKAIGNVVAQTVKQSQKSVQRNIQNVRLSNIDDFLQAHFEAAKEKLTDDELITRLQREGLTRAQAIDVQQYIVNQAKEVEQQAQKMVVEAKKALVKTEKAVRSAARWTALSWLISTILTFLATLAGAHSAVARIRD